jgi:hypothetical protein
MSFKLARFIRSRDIPVITSVLGTPWNLFLNLGISLASTLKYVPEPFYLGFFLQPVLVLMSLAFISL